MFRKIKDWLFTKTLIHREDTAKIATPMTQEDPAVHESRKRVRKAFEQQKKQMVSRRNRPHSMKCENPDICTKANCFKQVPDKIVEEIKGTIVIIQDIRENIKE
jgi:hypothetical protein